MSKKKELFKPKIESKVGMYVYGVTVYDLSHIGHAPVYVNFDLLYRLKQISVFNSLILSSMTEIEELTEHRQYSPTKISRNNQFPKTFNFPQCCCSRQHRIWTCRGGR
ncbi:cysteine--tRNA ligase, chloroplastic/mitochondrial-like [Vicia villosa]|uniref:cysteine--tRNA ligase, chloroplastic/mitochondrial-like n=1 Tax=Vicia villosa TaxID=3911 RepID=UPI00273ACBA5|nr:cysteine--tRNA ligase, chloroplastic/mitochondrial-like [Vicia villosa]